MTRLIHVLKNLLRHLFLNFVGMAEGFPREGCREAPHSLALCPLPFPWGRASISTAFPHLPSPLPNTTRGTDRPSLMHSSLVRLFHPGFEGPPLSLSTCSCLYTQVHLGTQSRGTQVLVFYAFNYCCKWKGSRERITLAAWAVLRCRCPPSPHHPLQESGAGEGTA